MEINNIKIKIPIIGDWGNNCNNVQLEIFNKINEQFMKDSNIDLIDKENNNIIISVGDTMYYDDEAEIEFRNGLLFDIIEILPNNLKNKEIVIKLILQIKSFELKKFFKKNKDNFKEYNLSEILDTLDDIINLDNEIELSSISEYYEIFSPISELINLYKKNNESHFLDENFIKNIQIFNEYLIKLTVLCSKKVNKKINFEDSQRTIHDLIRSQLDKNKKLILSDIFKKYITDGVKCITNNDNNSSIDLASNKRWIFTMGNHDEVSNINKNNFGLDCHYRDILLNVMTDENIIESDSLNKIKNGQYIETWLSNDYDIVFLVLNTNVLEIKDKEPECTYEVFKEILDLNEYKKKQKNLDIHYQKESEEREILPEGLLNEFSTIINFLNTNLEKFTNENKKVVLIGHHPIVMLGHGLKMKDDKISSSKLNKVYGNVFMRYLYDTIIKQYKCCIAYLCGHEHNLQLLTDNSNQTENGFFQFVISGSGGGNYKDEDSLDKVKNKPREEITKILEYDNINVDRYYSDWGFFNLIIDDNNLVTFQPICNKCSKGGNLSKNKLKFFRKYKTKKNIKNIKYKKYNIFNKM